MKRLLAALAALLLSAMPVHAKEPASLTLDTPGPYHYGDVISVTAHGDYPGHPGESKPKTHVRLTCYQAGEVVHFELYGSPAPEQPLVFHLSYGPSGFGNSLWDERGGGAADCTIEFYRVSYAPVWYTVAELYTSITIHAEP